jgi:hypothetical protein
MTCGDKTGEAKRLKIIYRVPTPETADFLFLRHSLPVLSTSCDHRHIALITNFKVQRRPCNRHMPGAHVKSPG